MTCTFNEIIILNNSKYNLLENEIITNLLGIRNSIFVLKYYSLRNYLSAYFNSIMEIMITN